MADSKQPPGDRSPSGRLAPDVTDYSKEAPPADPRLEKLQKATARIAQVQQAAKRDDTQKRALGAVLAMVGAIAVVGVLVLLVFVKTIVPMLSPPAPLANSRWSGGVKVAEKYGTYSNFAQITFPAATDKSFTAQLAIGRDPRDNVAELTGVRMGNRLIVGDVKILMGSPFSSAPEAEVKKMVLVVSGKRIKSSTEHVTIDVKRQN